MNHKRATLLMILILVTLLLVAGSRVNAASPQDVVIVPAGQPVQLALATWLDVSVPYEDYYASFDLAAADHGPIKGFNLQRNVFDAGCDQPSGQNAGDQIVANTQNLGVIGPFCSSSTFGMGPVLESAGVVMISYSNTSPLLDDYGWTVFNRVVVTDPEYVDWNEYITHLSSVTLWNDEFYFAYGRQPTEFAKYVYDSTLLLLNRLDEVSTLDGSGNLLVDRAALAAAVRDTFSYMGVTGRIFLEADGDRVNLLVIVPAGQPIQIALATWIDPGVPYQDYFDAFEMAVDDFGPIKTFSVQHNDFDTGCDPTAGEIAGNQVITNTQNLAVIGTYCSGSTFGMAPVLESAGVVMISYSNTRGDLGNYGWTIFNRDVVNDPEFNYWDKTVSQLPTVLDWNDNFKMIFGRDPTTFARYVYDATTLLLTRINEVSILDVNNNLLVDQALLASARARHVCFSRCNRLDHPRARWRPGKFAHRLLLPAGGVQALIIRAETTFTKYLLLFVFR